MNDNDLPCIICGVEGAELDCETCGEPICTDCVMDALGGYYCPACWDDVRANATINRDQENEDGALSGPHRPA